MTKTLIRAFIISNHALEVNLRSCPIILI